MIESNPLVSVIIPTYGRPDTLKRCIGSVLSQTYDNIEILVVDDNAPGTQGRSETEAVMACYAENPRIKYIRHPQNKNGSAARNTGWKASGGKYVTFLDDDDEFLPEKIEKQTACMEALGEDWGMCYTGYELKKYTGQQMLSTETRSGDCYLPALMRTMYICGGSNLFLRRSVIEEIGGYDESFLRNQDIEFLVRCTEKYKLANIPDTLLTVYQEKNRKKRTFDEVDRFSLYYLSVFEERINALPRKDRKRVQSVISLERFRVAIGFHEYKKGIAILINNKVSLFYLFRYMIYLLKRYVTGSSYGFGG